MLRYYLQTDVAGIWVEFVAHEKSARVKDIRFANWIYWLHCQIYCFLYF